MSICLRPAGRLFHSLWPAAAKHRSPKVGRSTWRQKSSSRQNAADDDLLQATADSQRPGKLQPCRTTNGKPQWLSWRWGGPQTCFLNLNFKWIGPQIFGAEGARNFRLSIDKACRLYNNLLRLHNPWSFASYGVWLNGNTIWHNNKVTLHWAGLVLRWVTILGYTIFILYR